jgi:hypothetical protein
MEIQWKNKSGNERFQKQKAAASLNLKMIMPCRAEPIPFRIPATTLFKPDNDQLFDTSRILIQKIKIIPKFPHPTPTSRNPYQDRAPHHAKGRRISAVASTHSTPAH